MNSNDLVNIRLSNQGLIKNEKKKNDSVKEIVSRMGAIQAQDFNMAKWAIGVRLPGSTKKTIEEAIDNGEIIRTHLLRPTWHFVSADDIRWMLKLTAPRIKASMKSRWKQLGLDEATLKKSRKVIEKSLEKNGNLTREELITELKKNKIPTNENRASHLFLFSELDAIICSGRIKNGKNTYALLDKRISFNKELSREESLAKIAEKYFSTRSPAELSDFSWWSGLNTGDCKLAVELIKTNLITKKSGTKLYWIYNDLNVKKMNKKSFIFLPAFDEFIISYKDRSMVIAVEDYKNTISSNGMFYPLLLHNGRLKGIWKRSIKKDKVFIEINFLNKTGKPDFYSIKKAANLLGKFLDKKPEIIY